MLSKATLSDRVKKAKTVKVTMINKNNFHVQGTKDLYHVRLDESAKPVRAICSKVARSAGGHYCKGNGKSVCYHVIAALYARATAANCNVAFCANRADAKNLSNLGGTFHRCENGLGSTEVWMVVFTAEVQRDQVDRIQAAYLDARIASVTQALETIEQRIEEKPWSYILRHAQKTHLAQLQHLVDQVQ